MTKKVLGLDTFNKLSQEKQFDLLYKEGVYIGKRRVEHQSVILFQLYSFYVEVYYREYRKHAEHLEGTEDIAILVPYLDQIHVRDLDNNKGK